MKFLITQFSPAPCYFLPNVLPSTLLLLPRCSPQAPVTSSQMFYPDPCYFFPNVLSRPLLLRPKCSLQTLVTSSQMFSPAPCCQIPSVHVLLLAWQTKFHSHT
jgi:hypothetical protein